MKQPVCLIVPILFISLNCFSQEENKKVEFGIKAGIISSGLSPGFTDSDGKKTEFRRATGIIIGGSMQIAAGKNTLILIEENLTPKGAKRYYDYGGGLALTRPSNYLTASYETIINLLYKKSAKKGLFLLGGGPFISFVTNDYNAENLGKTDAGINLLAGYRLPIGLSFELNFNKGFIKQKPEFAPTSYADPTTSYFGFCLGYLF